MKKLNYAKYLILKEWLPLFIVFTLVGSVSFFSYLAMHSFYSPDEYDTTLAALNFPMMVFAIVLPLFVFNYKYSLKRGDTYYQLPLEQRELKNTRVLTGLSILVVSFIIASIIPFFSYLVRYIISPDYIRIGSINFFKYFKAGPFLGAIGVSLVLVVIEYFISCFATSLVSKPVSAIAINLSFHAILIFSLYSICGCLYSFGELARQSSTYQYLDASYAAIAYSPGPVITISLPDYITRVYAFDLHYNEMSLDSDASYLAMVITNIVLEVLIGCATCFFTLFKKEDSGESCNNYGFANKKLNSLFFLSVIPIVLFAFSSDSFLGFDTFIGTVIVAAAYYFLFALFIGSFKMPAYSYIIIGAGTGVVIFGKVLYVIIALSTGI